MERVAVFVDAGYLFAAGSEAISGTKLKRTEVRLDEQAVVEELKRFATAVTGLPLLRIYWYDGTSGVMSVQQIALARCNDLKMRLGAVNSHGQQKGVDSLIITDIISLARNRAIADAILISGDEDVRVGMQQAQEWGVRVHLLGIDTGRNNQSPALVQEADTCASWTAAEVGTFLSAVPQSGASATVVVPAIAGAEAAALADVVETFVSGLPEESVRTCGAPSVRTVPADLDGRLLWKASEALGRKLEPSEKRDLRKVFLKECATRAQALPAPTSA